MPHFHPTKSAQMLSGNLSGETHAIPLSLLFAQLHSSEHGLTNEEVRKRLNTSGSNEAIEVKRHWGLVQFLRLFLNPLVLLLSSKRASGSLLFLAARVVHRDDKTIAGSLPHVTSPSQCPLARIRMFFPVQCSFCSVQKLTAEGGDRPGALFSLALGQQRDVRELRDSP